VTDFNRFIHRFIHPGVGAVVAWARPQNSLIAGIASSLLGWVSITGIPTVQAADLTVPLHSRADFSGQPASLADSPQPLTSQASDPLRPHTQCPATLEQLMPLMLRDLPSYANRVSQRAYTRHRTSEIPGYVLLAGRPEYEPLALGPGAFTAVSETEVPQVFFTTLERQYLAGESFSLQHYHWLFLTPIENGWRFVMLLSTLGNHPYTEPPTPPRDSSQGVIAQAVRLWLRDCQAGTIAP